MGTPASKATTTSVPALDDEQRVNHSLYDEYVRGFDEVPVLDDAVRVPPSLPRPPNFVRGERRSLRSEERPDGYSLREASVAELEQLYLEYVAPKPAARKPKKRATKKRSGRKRARPASGA
jgi:hypothetical protein